MDAFGELARVGVICVHPRKSAANK
jgi:hypothetical protein